MILGELEWNVLKLLSCGRLTPIHIHRRIDSHSERHLRRRLHRMEDAGLVCRVEPEDQYLYELTARGERAVEMCREHELDDGESRLEFRDRLHREVFGEELMRE